MCDRYNDHHGDELCPSQGPPGKTGGSEDLVPDLPPEYMLNRKKRSTQEGGKREGGERPVPESMREVVSEIFENIDELQTGLRALREPSGSRQNPGRTCRDIHLAHDTSPDGEGDGGGDALTHARAHARTHAHAHGSKHVARLSAGYTKFLALYNIHHS